jgi:hypothetical protein
MSAERRNGDVESAPASVTGEGQWVTPAVSYVDPRRRFCDLCGRPIARRFWQVETERGEGVFCDPGHAVLYTTYPFRSITH